MDDRGAPRIVTAVMTYNRRDLLRRCLQGIGAQSRPSGVVLVVDNASTDGSAEMLAREFPHVLVHRTGENLGCAGAMHEALRLALTMDPEYIWFFDDDVVPAPTCLEALLAEARRLERERRLGVLRMMIRDPQSGEVAGGGISSGSLLRVEMVRAVGLPRSELFIELSDHTYNALIRKSGYEILRLPLVLAEHPVERPRSLREIMARGYRVKPWRLYYAVRNRIWYSLYEQRSIRQFLRTVGLAVRAFTLLTIFGRPRRGQLLVVRGMIDGLLGRLGRRVEPNY